MTINYQPSIFNPQLSTRFVSVLQKANEADRPTPPCTAQPPGMKPDTNSVAIPRRRKKIPGVKGVMLPDVAAEVPKRFGRVPLRCWDPKPVGKTAPVGRHNFRGHLKLRRIGQKAKKEKAKVSSTACPVGRQAFTGARSTSDSLDAPRARLRPTPFPRPPARVLRSMLSFFVRQHSCHC
jgi:hypothetical protein